MNTTLHEAIRRVAEDPPRDPRALRKNFPKPLREILLKSVSRNPRERYATALELAEDLRRWTRGEPVVAGPPSIRRRMARLISIHPLLTTFAVCLSFVVLSIGSTIALVWYTNAQPNHIRSGPSKSAVELLARSGRIVHSWPQLNMPNSFVDQLIRRPGSAGGGRLAIVASAREERRRLRAVRAFDVDTDPARAVWWQDLTKDSPLPSILPPEITADQFFPRDLETHDIFPNSPGNEILVIYQHGRRSFCAVHIYSIDGVLLYQLWHDGNLMASHWLSDPAVLLLAGVNGEHPWADRGHPEETDFVHPKIVMAVRPRQGRMADTWTRPSGSTAVDDLLWYKCLLPARASRVFSEVTFEVPTFADPARAAGFGAFSREHPLASISWVIDGEGAVIQQVVSDAYQARPTLPSAGQFYLGDLPAVDPQAVQKQP